MKSTLYSALIILKLYKINSIIRLTVNSVLETLISRELTPDYFIYLYKFELMQVKVDHMAVALSKTYRSPTVDIIQSLPQHQQVGCF